MKESIVSVVAVSVKRVVGTLFIAVVLSTGYDVVESYRHGTQPPTPQTERISEQEVSHLKDETFKLAQQLLDTFPESEDPLMLMGDVLVAFGESPKAIPWWEKAVAKNPRKKGIYQRMADLSFDTDAYEEAISWGRKGLEIDPNMPGMHRLIARSLSPLGRYEEVVTEAKAELTITPNSWETYFLLGRAHWRLRAYGQAKQAYQRTIELKPDHTQAYYGLFNVCTRLKQPEEAQHNIDRFRALDEQNKADIERLDQANTNLNRAAYNFAILCIEAHKLHRTAGNVYQAEWLVKKAIALYPKNISYLEHLMGLYQEAQRIPEALSLCEQITSIDPNNVTCHRNRGDISFQLQHFDDAKSAYQEAIACTPQHFAGYQRLARLYLWTGSQLPQARVLAEKALDLHQDATNYFTFAWACDVNGYLEDALDALKHAMELDPSNAEYQRLYENIRKKGTLK